jgi:hypothetical protein
MIYENHIKTGRETKTGQPFFFTFPPWAALLAQNVHSAPITQQAEKLSFARAKRE